MSQTSTKTNLFHATTRTLLGRATIPRIRGSDSCRVIVFQGKLRRPIICCIYISHPTVSQGEQHSWRCVFLDASLNRLRGITAIADQPCLRDLVSQFLQYSFHRLPMCQTWVPESNFPVVTSIPGHIVIPCPDVLFLSGTPDCFEQSSVQRKTLPWRQ